MKKEEAINFGEMFLEVNKDSKNSSTYEFIELALKLLKQDSCEDVISKQAVKEFVEYIQTIKADHIHKDTPINYGTICDLVIRGWKLLESENKE